MKAHPALGFSSRLVTRGFDAGHEVVVQLAGEDRGEPPHCPVERFEQLGSGEAVVEDCGLDAVP